MIFERDPKTNNNLDSWSECIPETIVKRVDHVPIFTSSSRTAVPRRQYITTDGARSGPRGLGLVAARGTKPGGRSIRIQGKFAEVWGSGDV